MDSYLSHNIVDTNTMARSYYNILHIPTGLWVAFYDGNNKIAGLTKEPHKLPYSRSRFCPTQYNHKMQIPAIVTFDKDGIVHESRLLFDHEIEHGFCHKSEFEFIEIAQ